MVATTRRREGNELTQRPKGNHSEEDHTKGTGGIEQVRTNQSGEEKPPAANPQGEGFGDGRVNSPGKASAQQENQRTRHRKQQQDTSN